MIDLDQRRLLSDDEVISGKTKSSESDEFVRLHDSKISLDGIELPSLAVSIEPAEPDNTSLCSRQLDFQWEVIGFTESELIMKLDFSWPSCVSSSTSEGDLLVITFND